MNLTPLHYKLLREMKRDQWYDVFLGQSDGGEVLPQWLYLDPNGVDSMLYLVSELVEAGELVERVSDGLPQVMYCYMKEIK